MTDNKLGEQHILDMIRAIHENPPPVPNVIEYKKDGEHYRYELKYIPELDEAKAEETGVTS